jgi:hypothetical protein
MRSRTISAKIISANPFVTDTLTASTKTYQKILFEGIDRNLWLSEGFATSFSLCFCLNSSMFLLDVSLGFFTRSKF